MFSAARLLRLGTSTQRAPAAYRLVQARSKANEPKNFSAEKILTALAVLGSTERNAGRKLRASQQLKAGLVTITRLGYAYVNSMDQVEALGKLRVKDKADDEQGQEEEGDDEVDDQKEEDDKADGKEEEDDKAADGKEEEDDEADGPEEEDDGADDQEEEEGPQYQYQSQKELEGLNLESSDWSKWKLRCDTLIVGKKKDKEKFENRGQKLGFKETIFWSKLPQKL